MANGIMAGIGKDQGDQKQNVRTASSAVKVAQDTVQRAQRANKLKSLKIKVKFTGK